MTTMKNGELLYLSRNDVERVDLPMAEIVQRVEAVFTEKGHGRTEMPPKPGIHTQPDAFIHAMPAYVPAMQAAGVKWVSGYPANQSQGLPYITGLLILNDPRTGIPLSVMDCTWITAQRTAAASAVAAKYLCNPDARTMAVLACGVQGRSHLEAMRVVLPDLKEVRAYDIVPEVARAYAADAKTRYGLNVQVSADVRSAVNGADVIVTSGPILKKPDPPLAAEWVKPGTFLSAVDFDSYLQPDVFRRAGRLFTDDIGQFHYYRKVGYFQQTPEPHGDLGQLVTGQAVGRQSRNEITIAVNLGIALEDMAVAIEIYHRARRMQIGTPLPL
jgi:ornithine cyclodeaminase/alanine dehydrogenase-like protein (mu-crystallin family)